MKFILDTNIVSYVIRDYSAVLKTRFKEHKNDLYITEITKAELLFGAYRCEEAKQKRLLDKIELILNNVSLVSFSGRCIEIFARLRAEMYNSGKVIDDFDLMIASVTICNDGVLVTNNAKHFERISELSIENWL